MQHKILSIQISSLCFHILYSDRLPIFFLKILLRAYLFLPIKKAETPGQALRKQDSFLPNPSKADHSDKAILNFVGYCDKLK